MLGFTPLLADFMGLSNTTLMFIAAGVAIMWFGKNAPLRVLASNLFQKASAAASAAAIPASRSASTPASTPARRSSDDFLLSGCDDGDDPADQFGSVLLDGYETHESLATESHIVACAVAYAKLNSADIVLSVSDGRCEFSFTPLKPAK